MAASRWIPELRKFTSCDIGDALVKLRYPNGGFLDGIRMFSPSSHFPTPSSSTVNSAPSRIIGPAVTVEMVLASDTSAPKPDRHFADCNEKDHVMFISQPKGLPSACWGGLMSTRAKALGAAGVIVDGRIRDVGEHREFGFPVFARSSSILGSATFTRASRINVPLRYSDSEDLYINPGDILVGDIDGVVVVPPDLAGEVVQLCRERADMDEKMFEGLRKGERMGDLITKLRR